MYTLIHKDQTSKARLGKVSTNHGQIDSPFFMPVGTNGTVKSMTVGDLHQVNAQIMLSNTYHLYLRPGMDILKNFGGLHQFIGWDKPMLTDSGGYQVFSLTKLRKLTEEGVEFRSHLDGSKHLFTPEKVMEIESVIGADMIMPLDVCAPYPCGIQEAEQSVRLTTQWARQSKDYFDSNKMEVRQRLFGIVQGATYKELREQSAKEISQIPFDGYAVGGVSVGEPVEEMFKALDWVMPILPENKPRYFMGIGLPDQIVKAVGCGIDMFDTVLPTRFGRHGTAFSRKGRYIIKNAEFKNDKGPLDESCTCKVCNEYSRGYIRHLCMLNEITGLHLVTYHNLSFYINLMKDIREAIANNQYADFENDFLRKYNSPLLKEN